MLRKLVTTVLAFLVVSAAMVAVQPTQAQGTLTLNGTVKVIKADIIASNGVIHIIDSVLLPPAMMSATMSGTMAMAPTMSGTMMMAPTMSGTMMMAPTMSGTMAMAATMRATMAMSGTMAMAPTMSGTMVMTTTKTIAELAVATPELSTLVAALKAANLVDTFSKPGNFTVFAPTNDAFTKAMTSMNVTAAQVMADVPTLTNILTYHVVPQVLKAADLVKLTSVKTLQGATITLAVK